MTNSLRYTMTVTADCCGFAGTLAAVELHDCTIVENGGRCEDYPCCGHTDGDGCQMRPSHTSAFWLDHPHLLDGDDAYDGYGDRDEYDAYGD